MSRAQFDEGEDVEEAADTVRKHARPLDEDALNRLVEAAGKAQYVLLGEASHGTAEFYRWRARLTAQLVREQDASFVAVEGDWTDCSRINRYIRGEDTDGDASDILSAFDRWPTWMWANWEVAEFVEWLRRYNESGADVGFYGMDVYSLFESMETVIDYLEEVDPEVAEQARDAYHCFKPYGEDAKEYARSTRLVPEDCEDEVIVVLSKVRERAPQYLQADGESYFDAEQNALIAANAEEYYRAMAQGDKESWNVRDGHMAETLERLADRHGGPAVIWAHNTHVGDARATDMVDRGRVNVGHLLREHADGNILVVGSGTHRGRVIAGKEWGAPREQMRVPPAREGSYGDAFHRADVGDSLLVTDDIGGALSGPRGQRAIGVVYDPDHEWGNYVPTRLDECYDAFVHVEETGAVHPLDTGEDARGPPEAYPWRL